MRKIVIAAVAVVVLIVVAMFLLPYFIDINQHRDEIQAQLQDRLHRPVKLGAMSLAVFPLRVEVEGRQHRRRSALSQQTALRPSR